MASCITIKQPWASLICSGIKDIENRTWKTNFRGRVLIHAGATSATPISVLPHSVFTQDQWADIDEQTRREIVRGRQEKSAIIGSVEIVDCVQNHSSVWAEHWANKKWFNEQTKSYVGFERQCYNWVLANPIKFDTPIPAKGKLSFWEFNEKLIK